MMEKNVVAILVAGHAREAMKNLESVEAEVGRGLVGDRYFLRQGTFFQEASKRDDPSREVTLIEQEALEALAREYHIELSHAQSRRNVLTRGIALNHLVGVEFTIGGAEGVTLRGLRLCEPCGHLERINGLKLEGLKHRGGLRAQVIKSGTLRVGDAITPLRQHDAAHLCSTDGPVCVLP